MGRQRKTTQRKLDFAFPPIYEKEFNDFLKDSDKDIKLNGFYVSHRFSRDSKGNERMIASYKHEMDGFTESENMRERSDFWHDKRNELWRERDKHSVEEPLYDELDKRGDYAELKWLQYHEAIVDAFAKLKVGKYWEGIFIEETDNQAEQPKVSNSTKHDTTEKVNKKEHGALKKTVNALAQDYECKPGQTVNKKIKMKMLEELERDGFGKVSDATLRVTLQRLSYSKEKPN